MLEATYAGSPSKPTRPATEEQLTMVYVKHFSNFMLHAEPNPFQVYGNGFIPLYNQPWEQNPSIPALLA
jgi:hypothetical protein